MAEGARVTLLLLIALVALQAAASRHALAQEPPAAKTIEPNTKKESAAAPAKTKDPVRVTRFAAPPVIDGRPDDEVWQSAAILKDFYQVEPGDNIQPSKPTEVRLGYDSKFLYIAFHAYDDPEKVRATVAKRDTFDDDNVQIYFDTYNDKRKAYLLIFNPFGIQSDCLFTEENGEDFSFDIVMESKGMLTKDGYTVEVAIPFKSLRFESGEGRLWGVHVMRRIRRLNNEKSSWMPLSRDNSSLLSQAGHITGLEGISNGRDLELIPSLTLSEAGRRISAPPRAGSVDDIAAQNSDRFVTGPLQTDPGLTAKLGLASSVVVALTLNPDFAQVEADELVVTANQRFPIFFEEKRPFFLEGVDIFQTPLNALNTRAIVDPDVAVKLTGKRGRNSFGLLFASDNAPGNFSEDERSDPENLRRIERFLDKNAHIGVLRVKRDIGYDSSVGLIATTYNFIEDHNHVAGVDGRFRVNRQTTLSFQALGTTSRFPFFDPQRNRNVYRVGNAFGYYFNYDYAGRHFGYNLSGQGRTSNYRANVGFTQRTNTNREELFLRYNSEPKPEAKFTSWRLSNSTAVGFDWQRRMQLWNNRAEAQFNFIRQSYAGFGVSGGYERVFEEEFGARRGPSQAGAFAGDDPERSSGNKSVYGFGGTTLSRKYSASFFVERRWGALDFDLGADPRFKRVSPRALLDADAPLDPGPGDALDINATFVYQPTNLLRVSLDYTKSKLVRYDTGLVAFDDNIYSVRSTYQFTRFTFFRGRLDYSTLALNLRTQFLYGWTPNPGTSFYIGYNDDLNRYSINPVTGRLEPALRRNGRTFFIKMSYLFRRSF